MHEQSMNKFTKELVMNSFIKSDAPTCFEYQS